MSDQPDPERRGLSRGSFLKSIAGIGGAGVGVLFGASKAAASPAINKHTTCCHVDSSPCGKCPGSNLVYKCTSDCYASYKCICYPNMGNCFTVSCTT